VRNIADERESNPLNAIYMALEIKIAKNAIEVACNNLVIFTVGRLKSYPS